MKQYDGTKATRSTTRSDGSVKVYGHTMSGELLTVVMVKDDISNNYNIQEIKVAGKITLQR